MKTIAVHQPNFLPWLGYFYKIKNADLFVIQDDVDFESGNAESVTNRTRIKTPGGERKITVPVKHNTGEKHINRIIIDNSQNWIAKQLNIVRNAYLKTPYFGVYFPQLQETIGKRHLALADLNSELIELCCSWLDITTPLLKSSTLQIDGLQKSELLLEICTKLDATHYLSGNGARKYNDPELFSNKNVELVYSSFRPVEYPQFFGEFIPGLSVIDAFFNLGPESKTLLTDEKSTYPGV
jgi:hypothetical protein